MQYALKKVYFGVANMMIKDRIQFFRAKIEYLRRLFFFNRETTENALKCCIGNMGRNVWENWISKSRRLVAFLMPEMNSA